MSTSSGNSTTSQPSSILFFIAIAIGIVIAMVFIFFSLRYYVRTKLGIYATARLTTGGPNGNVILLNGDFPIQQLNIYHNEFQNHMRAQRRRRKYMKKRRLTEQEVDHLFPTRTYQNWLDGGAERDIENRDIMGQLKEEHDEVIHEQQEAEAAEAAAEVNPSVTETDPTAETTNTTTTLTENTTSTTTPETTQTTPTPPAEVDLGNPYTHEIHFDSGTCAICIDTFEPEDTVRGLICGHVFHQECLDPWLTKRKACCPMCKRDYYLKDNDTNGSGIEPTTTADAIGEDHADLESFVGWPELQYTTLEDRVREILQRNPELEEVAREQIKQYRTVKWRFFWFVMGISNADLLNCTIASEDERRREAGVYDRSTTDGEVQVTGNETEVIADVADIPTAHVGDSRLSQEARRESVERLA